MRRISRDAILRAAVLVPVLVVVAGCRTSDDPGPSEPLRPMTPTMERLLVLGTDALQRHDFDRAMAYVDSAASIEPDRADVPFLRGRILAELARLDEAERAYRDVLTLRPDYPGVWHNLANNAFRQQRYSEAVRRYYRELEQRSDPRPWRGIARSYVELGRTDSAAYAYDRALALDSTFAAGHFGRALLLDDLGRTEEALVSALEALRHEPENHEYRYHVGSYLMKIGRSDEALGYFQRVADVWPWHQGAHYNLAQALMRLGRTAEAAVYQARAEELRALQAQISHHENTARVQPMDPLAHAGLATLLRRAGRYNDAMHAYRVALYLDPENLDILHNVGVLHLLRGDTTDAIRTFEQIVRVDSTREHAWRNLATIYRLVGR